ncbi:hypothetical protein HWV00_17420 [Moritella sp. 24]|uniref:hypothetical protein n=1 Tax=Moritella sp. 24 TaxID=2746230 RepID=UPI001BAB3A6C|nr:hypothetical protein [Moritella sp. 24]QUM77861.1 hypothetical protein HWV00_17420 [Moritella sp. 24]
MKKLLMVCYGGGHMKIIAPLYHHLKNEYDITVLALTIAQPFMSKSGIPYVGFNDFECIKTNESIAFGRELVKNIPHDNLVPIAESISYLGASFSDLVTELGSVKLAYEKFDKEGRACFLPTISLTKIIQQLDVDVVVTTNSPRAERAALIAAKALDIPSICINDNLGFFGGLIDIVQKNLATKVCVLSESLKNVVLNHSNLNSKDVIVTGSPVFDNLKEKPKTIFSSEKPKVLLADDDLPKTHLRFKGVIARNENIDVEVREELNKLSKEGKIKAIFRPHPNREYNYDAYKYCEISKPTEELNSVLAKVDLIVTANSTVGIEGKCLGLGLVSIEETVYSTLESYAGYGLATGVTEASELWKAIQIEFSKLDNGNVVELYKGRSVDNISNVVKELLAI